MTVQAYIIHLERATARRQNVDVLSRSAGIDPCVVPAIDSAAIPSSDSHRAASALVHPRYPFALHASEKAAFLSHRACWQRLLDEAHDMALVIEDDVILGPDFHKAMALARASLTPGALVRFPVKRRETALATIASRDSTRLFRPRTVGLGMQVQLVTREAAIRLLAATERFDRPVDTFVQMTWRHRADVLTVWPSGVSETSRQLGGSTIQRMTMSLRQKLHHELMRPLYRIRIAWHARYTQHASQD